MAILFEQERVKRQKRKVLKNISNRLVVITQYRKTDARLFQLVRSNLNSHQGKASKYVVLE